MGDEKWDGSVLRVPREQRHRLKDAWDWFVDYFRFREDWMFVLLFVLLVVGAALVPVGFWQIWQHFTK